jgi:hypothetical protein
MRTTRGGINLRWPSRARYRGVHRQGPRYRAHLKLGGQERVLGLYETPAAAARARDVELRRLGLHDLARLQAACEGSDARQTPGGEAAVAAAELGPPAA